MIMTEIKPMKLKPITFRAACAFVSEVHRHHKAPRGHKFSIGLVDENEELIGVAMVGRPVSRVLDDGYTAEVIRMATDGSKNACSMLYGASWRAAKGMGYTRIITYILQSETGISLRAAGWRLDGEVKGRSWNCPSRPRTDKTSVQTDDKERWMQCL